MSDSQVVWTMRTVTLTPPVELVHTQGIGCKVESWTAAEGRAARRWAIEQGHRRTDYDGRLVDEDDEEPSYTTSGFHVFHGKLICRLKFGHPTTSGRAPAMGALMLKNAVSMENRTEALDTIESMENTMRAFPALCWYNNKACKHQIRLLQSIWHWIEGVKWEVPEGKAVGTKCPHFNCCNEVPFEDFYCPHCCVRMTE